MSRALLTLLAALGVLGSPIVREVCLVNCASPSTHHADHQQTHDAMAADHACHESDTSSLPALGAVPHGCEHDSPDPLSTTASAATDARCAPAVAWAVPTLAGGSVESAAGLHWSRGREPDLPQYRRTDTPIPLRI
jgi:hypothetical protein